MYVIPAPGRTVPDPDRGDYLPPEGREVPDNQWWQRRKDDNDVIVTEAVQAPGPVKSTTKTKA